jgi:hypothetical protein
VRGEYQQQIQEYYLIDLTKKKKKNYMIKRVVSHFVPQLLPNLFILFDFFSRLILRNLIFLMIKY